MVPSFLPSFLPSIPSGRPFFLPTPSLRSICRQASSPPFQRAKEGGQAAGGNKKVLQTESEEKKEGRNKEGRKGGREKPKGKEREEISQENYGASTRTTATASIRATRRTSLKPAAATITTTATVDPKSRGGRSHLQEEEAGIDGRRTGGKGRGGKGCSKGTPRRGGMTMTTEEDDCNGRVASPRPL